MLRIVLALEVRSPAAAAASAAAKAKGRPYYSWLAPNPRAALIRPPPILWSNQAGRQPPRAAARCANGGGSRIKITPTTNGPHWTAAVTFYCLKVNIELQFPPPPLGVAIQMDSPAKTCARPESAGRPRSCAE